MALILDGGFVKKKLREQHGRFPSVEDITRMCDGIIEKEPLKAYDLFRIYWYDAPPFEGSGRNPISRIQQNFSTTKVAKENRSLLDSLEMQPKFAVRRGRAILRGWKVRKQVIGTMARQPRPLRGDDLIPEITQKGVDIRIGLDVAQISAKRIVDALVLVSGDSDFIPVMKFARREGLLVFLETLGHGVHRDLKAHADVVL